MATWPPSFAGWDTRSNTRSIDCRRPISITFIRRSPRCPGNGKPSRPPARWPPAAGFGSAGSSPTRFQRPFAGLDVLRIRGEVEQLYWRLDEVLAAAGRRSTWGAWPISTRFPPPDWSAFAPRSFRVSYDFSRFPTALVQLSRGCTLACDYCPYIVLEKATRFRQPERVVAEMADGIGRHGFRSFKFRDPLFGLDRPRAVELAERIEHLPKPIQFSIETRIDLLGEPLLRRLRAAGLSSVTFGVETPDQATLRAHRRAPIADDAQQRFVALCRQLGVRTVAGFMLGFPDDTPERIDAVLDYARRLKSDVRQLQHRHALSGHGLFPAAGTANRPLRLRPLRRLHAGAPLHASDGRRAQPLARAGVSQVLFSLALADERPHRSCGPGCLIGGAALWPAPSGPVQAQSRKPTRTSGATPASRATTVTGRGGSVRRRRRTSDVNSSVTMPTTSAQNANSFSPIATCTLSG